MAELHVKGYLRGCTHLCLVMSLAYEESGIYIGRGMGEIPMTRRESHCSTGKKVTRLVEHGGVGMKDLRLQYST